MTKAFIILGSNIEPDHHLPDALRRLRGHFDVSVLSRVYRSEPINAVGTIDPDAPVFLNAAILIETDVPIEKLKFDVLRGIEADMGRVREGDKFAPRPIDLDIALYGNLVINEHDLTIPDPDILKYPHIALPLADLAPDFPHPLTGVTLQTIAEGMLEYPGIIVVEIPGFQ